jgi:hypothetical protein
MSLHRIRPETTKGFFADDQVVGARTCFPYKAGLLTRLGRLKTRFVSIANV